MMTDERNHRNDAEDAEKLVLTNAVKAGRRTYFFDVRATRNDDYYLTITESRKSTAPDGSVRYDRHKIFLYKEDFEKFAAGLTQAVDFIHSRKGEQESTQETER